MTKKKKMVPETGHSHARNRTLLLLLSILILASLLRFFYLQEVRDAPDFGFPQVDAEFHDYWARGLAFGEWALEESKGDPKIRQSAYFRPPGYPYFLAFVYQVAGPGYLGPRIFQMFLGLINILLAFALVRRWLGRSVALLTSLLMGIYWIFIYYEGEFLETPLMVACILVLLNALSRWTTRITLRGAVLAGIVLGLSALVRPNALIFLPLVLGWAYWLTRGREGTKAFRIASIGFLLGAALAILPATIRNYAVSGEPVLITSNAGINLYMGNNETADGRCPGFLPGLGTFKTCYDYPGIVGNLEKRVGRNLNDSEVSNYFTGEALRYIGSHPGRFLALLARKAMMFWGPIEVSHNKVEEAERDNSRILSAIPGSFSMVFTLAILGATLMILELRGSARAKKHSKEERHRKQILFLVLGTILAWFLSFLPFFMAARYRVPIIPFLLAFGAYALYALIRFVAGRDVRRLAIWATLALVVFLLVDRNWAGYRVDRARWHYARGMGYNDSKRLDQAMDEWQKAVDLNPEYVSAHIDLGIGLAMRGRDEEAHRHLLRAVEIEPSNPHAQFNLGAFNEKMGRFEESRSRYLRALEIDPAFRPARAGLERIEAMRQPERKAQEGEF